MDTFGFTRKKFLSLTPENQHRHLVQWLSAVYQKLTTNRITTAGFDQLCEHYNQILKWGGMMPFNCPESTETRIRLECISDAIHFHRCKAGLFCMDHALLTPVQTDDSNRAILRLDCHIALDGLRSLFNVGSIFRVCEAAGFSSVILGNTLGKENEKIKKTAMGAHDWITQEKTGDLAQTLLQKKEKGYKIIGVETMPAACAFDKFEWPQKSIIVLGNEEYGISSHVLKICDEYVCIPMYGNKNSINVANSAAIICFHMAGALADGTCQNS
ncbi:MAG: hypothetical protein KKE62_05055 [Proteobacteria bacterium]|nr:hypothetical protein [Pseudomonadota bacterium]MBU1388132.1 hypothetical protein [Pseudomonadota bacterium]MBU1542196.1 hypothetical protein [Pseudomonadota bacterium]MBU2431174.1 hypothetical protein [Pseudomonadota bacterium]MBU2481648.1 hypothetical protein [Pseudomonadota bacterium]